MDLLYGCQKLGLVYMVIFGLRSCVAKAKMIDGKKLEHVHRHNQKNLNYFSFSIIDKYQYC
jgi:hypothetical protein